jgi:hypothetical protein
LSRNDYHLLIRQGFWCDLCLLLFLECLTTSSLPVIFSFSRHLFLPSDDQFLPPVVIIHSSSCKESSLWSYHVGTWSWCFSFLKLEKAYCRYKVLG